MVANHDAMAKSDGVSNAGSFTGWPQGYSEPLSAVWPMGRLVISARHAMLRQAQEYFHSLLLGVVKWDDVEVDRPIPIPPVRGYRDQGLVRDLVVARFNGFRLEMASPFDDVGWPMGRVSVTRGPWSIEGPLDARTWQRVAEFVKEQKAKGESDGDIAGGTDWGR